MQPSSGMQWVCAERKKEFWFRSLLQKYVPLHDIHILTMSHCSCSTVHVSVSPSTVFDAGIRNLQHSSDIHWTCASGKQNFDLGHFCKSMPPEWHKCTYFGRITMYSRLSLSWSRRDPLKYFEISVLRHIRCAELRKIAIEQPNFTNERVGGGGGPHKALFLTPT